MGKKYLILVTFNYNVNIAPGLIPMFKMTLYPMPVFSILNLTTKLTFSLRFDNENRIVCCRGDF